MTEDGDMILAEIKRPTTVANLAELPMQVIGYCCSFLDLHEHLLLLPHICKNFAKACQQPVSFPPIIDLSCGSKFRPARFVNSQVTDGLLRRLSGLGSRIGRGRPKRDCARDQRPDGDPFHCTAPHDSLIPPSR